MREIKFRAWAMGKSFICPSNSFSLAIHDTGPTIAMWSSDGVVDEFPAENIDQYTGIKDKDGAEIYEGDIVQVDCYGDLTKFEVVGPNPDYPAFELSGWDGDSNGLSHCICAEGLLMEVIGNVYENPDLIKSE